jgi:hypothetical protein
VQAFLTVAYSAPISFGDKGVKTRMRADGQPSCQPEVPSR